MSVQGQQYVDGMTQILDSPQSEIGHYLRDYECKPVEPSAAVTEQRTFPKPDLISAVYSQGLMRIGLAGEHMARQLRGRSKSRYSSLLPW